ncbi:hypothetical protein M422DRAFT_35973 [Sphaerobolus stellatus SS14]|uniref:LIM zinc-binding domain-containing protein n=1 Tax=Sphaerobolus stellatus (strain SS14) TaxID=990650 RepID=A0A0C9V406_SPHS4|nr:hypothetical protein M422DRAFT_35973 [Sphaerobolus stellatus SS14]
MNPYQSQQYPPYNPYSQPQQSRGFQQPQPPQPQPQPQQRPPPAPSTPYNAYYPPRQQQQQQPVQPASFASRNYQSYQSQPPAQPAVAQAYAQRSTPGPFPGTGAFNRPVSSYVQPVYSYGVPQQSSYTPQLPARGRSQSPDKGNTMPTQPVRQNSAGYPVGTPMSAGFNKPPQGYLVQSTGFVHQRPIAGPSAQAPVGYNASQPTSGLTSQGYGRPVSMPPNSYSRTPSNSFSQAPSQYGVSTARVPSQTYEQPQAIAQPPLPPSQVSPATQAYQPQGLQSHPPQTQGFQTQQVGLQMSGMQSLPQSQTRQLSQEFTSQAAPTPTPAPAPAPAPAQVPGFQTFQRRTFGQQVSRTQSQPSPQPSQYVPPPNPAPSQTIPPHQTEGPYQPPPHTLGISHPQPQPLPARPFAPSPSPSPSPAAMRRSPSPAPPPSPTRRRPLPATPGVGQAGPPPFSRSPSARAVSPLPARRQTVDVVPASIPSPQAPFSQPPVQSTPPSAQATSPLQSTNDQPVVPSKGPSAEIRRRALPFSPTKPPNVGTAMGNGKFKLPPTRSSTLPVNASNHPALVEVQKQEVPVRMPASPWLPSSQEDVHSEDDVPKAKLDKGKGRAVEPIEEEETIIQRTESPESMFSSVEPPMPPPSQRIVVEAQAQTEPEPEPAPVRQLEEQPQVVSSPEPICQIGLQRTDKAPTSVTVPTETAALSAAPSNDSLPSPPPSPSPAARPLRSHVRAPADVSTSPTEAVVPDFAIPPISSSPRKPAPTLPAVVLSPRKPVSTLPTVIPSPRKPASPLPSMVPASEKAMPPLPPPSPQERAVPMPSSPQKSTVPIPSSPFKQRRDLPFASSQPSDIHSAASRRVFPDVPQQSGSSRQAQPSVPLSAQRQPSQPTPAPVQQQFPSSRLQTVSPPQTGFTSQKERPTQSLAFRLAAMSFQEDQGPKHGHHPVTPAAPVIQRPVVQPHQHAAPRMQIPVINVPDDDDGDDDDESDDEEDDGPSMGPTINISGPPPPSINVSSAPSITFSSAPSINVTSHMGPSVTISSAPSITVSSESNPPSTSKRGVIPSIILDDLAGNLNGSHDNHSHTAVASSGRRHGQAFRAVGAKKGGFMCYGCGRGIVGRIVSAMGGRWHPACFRCCECGELLEHVSSYEHEGQPYCHLDYHEKFAPQCYHCHTPIIDEHFVTLDDPVLGKRTYHELHFFCAECGEPFITPEHAAKRNRARNKNRYVDEDDDDDYITEPHPSDIDVAFTVYQGHPYCEPCHVRLRYPKCKQCKKSLRDGDKAIEALGGIWCWECFVCGRCEKPFDDPAFFQRDKKAYCQPCYSIMLRNEL